MPNDPAPQWTDAHCHLDDPRQPGGLEAVLAAARTARVLSMITVGCDAASSQRAVSIARAHHGVWATVGLHPHDARFGVESIVPVLDDPASAEVVVAVGETGLDYFYDHSPREAQRQAFAAQVQLAHERRLPLVIHTRAAWADTFDVLAAEGVPERTIFHCFTGGVAEADRCLDLGAFLSFSGIVTFKGATDVQDAARRCPLDRLLVETDSPYLAPVPHRGRPNQPAYVPLVGAAIAALHGVTAARVAEQTQANVRAAFPRLAA